MDQRIPPKSSKYNEELQAQVQRLAREQERLMVEMGSKWDQKKAQVISKISADNLDQREKIFKEQTRGFFKDHYSIDLEGFLAPKPNLLCFPKLVYQEESIIVYGVDFMSPTRLYNYFRYFLPTSIGWMNDSTCKVTFKYCIKAKKAILQNVLPDCGRVYKVQKGVWYPLKPYFVLGFQRPLEARIATSFDITVTEIEDSKYVLYEEGRKKYLEEIENLGKKSLQPVNIPQPLGNYTFENFELDSNPLKQEYPLRGNKVQDSLVLQQYFKEQEEVELSPDPFMTSLTRISTKEQEREKRTEQSHIYKLMSNSQIESEEESMMAYLQSLNIRAPNPFNFNLGACKNVFN